jgi:peptidyl-prolyl cis-trans isomerase C
MAMPAFAQEAGAPATEGGAPAPAVPATADTVVATVNGIEITLGHMIALRDRLPEQYRSLPAEVLFEGVLDQLIQQTALSEAAGAPTQRTEVALENERRGLLAGQVVADVADAAVTDEALQQAYDAAYSAAEPQTEYNASHILVATEDEAKAIADELKGGADFATLAKEKSTGPSGPNGGELGWFSADMMVPPFSEAVAAMDTGAISDPVQTQFGWHVIKLNDTREQTAPNMDEVRDDLTAQIQQKAVQDKIDAVTASADVTRSVEGIDPSVLDDQSLLD